MRLMPSKVPDAAAHPGLTLLWLQLLPPHLAGEACSRYFAEQFPALRPMRPWEGIADYV